MNYVLPAPNRRAYDADNEAQMRRLLEIRLREIQTALTSQAPIPVYAIEGGNFATTYDYAADGGAFTDTTDLIFNAGGF